MAVRSPLHSRFAWTMAAVVALTMSCSRPSASTQAAEKHRAFIVSVFGDLAELDQTPSGHRVELDIGAIPIDTTPIAAIPIPSDAAGNTGNEPAADSVAGRTDAGWRYRYVAVYAPNDGHGAVAVFDELIEWIEAHDPVRSAWLTPAVTVYCAVFERPDGVSGSLLLSRRSSRELRDQQRTERISGVVTNDSERGPDLVAIEFFDDGPCHRDDLVPFDDEP